MQNAPAPREAVAPLATVPVTEGVPRDNPTGTQAKLIVTKGGDRIDNSTAVTPLAGATFEFYKVTSATALAGGSLVKSCITDGNGKCGVIVNLDNKDNNYFYAKETSAPKGWTNGLIWGGNSDHIRYNSGVLKQVSGNNKVGPTANLPGTNRTWPNIRPNPDAPQKCGIKMAVVFDLSWSIQRSDSLGDYKDAGKAFVDSLKGTPSEIALKTFASQAPAKGVTNASVPLTSVAQSSGADALKDKIDGFSIPKQLDSAFYTNWDAGLSQVEPGYDVVLFLTDGEPTRYGNGTSQSNQNSTLQTVEEAIHSANKVKETGTKVIAVGIGMEDDNLTENTQRLKLISGTEPGVDHFTTAFSNLGQTLKTMATKDCLGTVTVVKEIQKSTGAVTPGAGWTFRSGTTSVTAGEGTTGTGNTNGIGALNFKVGGFTGSETESRNVTIEEEQKPGFELVKQGLFNAKCTSNDKPIEIVDSGALGFTVPVKKNDVISCKVINKELTSSITIVKTAKDYNGGNPVTGPGNAPNVPSGTMVTWTYTVKNTGTTILNNVAVTDDKAGDARCELSTLKPGQTTTCTATGKVEAQ